MNCRNCYYGINGGFNSNSVHCFFCSGKFKSGVKGK